MTLTIGFYVLQKYLHESRHRHAMNRIRGEGGRFHGGSVRERLAAEKQAKESGSSGSANQPEERVLPRLIAAHPPPSSSSSSSSQTASTSGLQRATNSSSTTTTTNVLGLGGMKFVKNDDELHHQSVVAAALASLERQNQQYQAHQAHQQQHQFDPSRMAIITSSAAGHHLAASSGIISTMNSTDLAKSVIFTPAGGSAAAASAGRNGESVVRLHVR
jgi:hypothetical protein